MIIQHDVLMGRICASIRYVTGVQIPSGKANARDGPGMTAIGQCGAGMADAVLAGLESVPVLVGNVSIVRKVRAGHVTALRVGTTECAMHNSSGSIV